MLKKFVVLSLLLLPIQMAWGRTVTDSVNGFSVDIPDDWRQIPQADFDRHMNAIFQSGKSNFVMGFEPASHTRNFQHPYLTIQVIPHPSGQPVTNVTESSLQQLVAQITGTTQADIKKIVKTTASVPSVDSRSASYFTSPPGFIEDTNETVNHTAIHFHSIGLIGRDHNVRININMLAADSAAAQPTIDSIAASFRLDASQQVTCKSNVEKIATIVGGMVGAIATIVVILVLRRNAA